MNNRTDLERAQAEHWYRIPVQSAPDGVRDIRWIALFAKLKPIRITMFILRLPGRKAWRRRLEIGN